MPRDISCQKCLLGLWPSNSTSRNLPRGHGVRRAGTYSRKVTATCFVTAKIWRQPKYPSTEEWSEKLHSIQTMTYYVVDLPKNEVELFVLTWINLRITSLLLLRRTHQWCAEACLPCCLTANGVHCFPAPHWWQRISGLKSVTREVFTPWKLENATDQSFFPPESQILNIYQHTTERTQLQTLCTHVCLCHMCQRLWKETQEIANKQLNKWSRAGLWSWVPGAESWLWRLQPVRPWVSHLTSLCLGFLICKVEIIVHTSWSCWRE